MAMESGLICKTQMLCTTQAQEHSPAGITSEITGRGDFATSFTNSAIGSGVDYGVREANESIDKQFRTAATDWNEKDKEGEPVSVATTGAGIPDEVVGQVTVSGYGVENDAGTFDVPQAYLLNLKMPTMRHRPTLAKEQPLTFQSCQKTSWLKRQKLKTSMTLPTQLAQRLQCLAKTLWLKRL
jgi:hypothetical protein